MSKPQVLYSIAFIALAMGAMAYLLDRPANQTYFMPDWFGPVEGASGGLHDSLPSFLHAFAFSLATIAAIAPATAWAVARICTAWWLLETLLEVIQLELLADKVIALIPDVVVSLPVLSALPSYARNGTFDVADLTAAATGCVLAYLIGVTCPDRRTAPCADQ